MAPSTRAALRTRSVNVPFPSTVCTRKRVSAQKRPRANVDPLRRSERVRLREAAVASETVPSATTSLDKSLHDIENSKPQSSKRKKTFANDKQGDDFQGPAIKRRRRSSVARKINFPLTIKHPPIPVVPPIPGVPEAPSAEKEQFLRLMMEPPPVPPSDVVQNGCSVNAEIREILVDWMMEVANEYSARPETLASAVSFLDRVLFKVTMVRKNLQLLAAVCVMVACKLEESDPPGVCELIFLCDHAYSRASILEMEKMVITHLNFDMSQPTYVSMVSKIAKEVAKECKGSDGRKCDCNPTPNSMSEDSDVVEDDDCDPAETFHSLENEMVQASEFAARIALHDMATCHYPPCVVAAGCVMAACNVQKISPDHVVKCMGAKELWKKHYDDIRAAEARIFRVVQTLMKRHEVDKSRFVLLKWSCQANDFGIAAAGFSPYVSADAESTQDISEIVSQQTSLSGFGSNVGHTMPR